MLKGGKPMTKRPPFVNRRELIVASSALIAAPAVLRTGALAQDTGPIRLAGLLSLTGGGSPFGPNSRIAHQAVVDEVNAAGGVLGRKIEYLAEDDQTNPEAGVRAARKLIDVDRVSAIMSVWASAVGIGGAAAVLGEQDHDACDLGRRFNRRAAPPGLFRAHAAAYRAAGAAVRRIRDRPPGEALLRHDAAELRSRRRSSGASRAAASRRPSKSRPSFSTPKSSPSVPRSTR